MRRQIAEPLAVALVLVWAADAAAQCALCGQAAAYAGTSPQRTLYAFLAAALVLLIPALGAAAAIGRALWRHRDP